MEQGERGDQLRRGVGVHVGGLNRDEGAQRAGLLQDQLSDEPGVDEAVVGVDEHPVEARVLAPARGLRHARRIRLARSVLGLRAGGEDANPRIRHVHTLVSSRPASTVTERSANTVLHEAVPSPDRAGVRPPRRLRRAASGLRRPRARRRPLARRSSPARPLPAQAPVLRAAPRARLPRRPCEPVPRGSRTGRSRMLGQAPPAARPRAPRATSGRVEDGGRSSVAPPRSCSRAGIASAPPCAAASTSLVTRGTPCRTHLR